MICTNCSKEIPDGAQFCQYCGASQETPQTPMVETQQDAGGKLPIPDGPGTTMFEINMRKRRQNRKNLLIILGVVAFVLLVSGGLFLNWYNAPAQQFNRAMDANDYVAAGSHFFSIPEEENQEATDRVMELANDAYVDYNAGNTDYESVSAFLNTLSENFGIPKLPVMAVELQHLRESKESFDKASQAENQGDTLSALKAYEAVIPDDTNREKAETKAKEMREKYTQELTEQAAALAKNQEYIGAVALLQEGKKVLGANDELEKLIEGYESQADKKAAAEVLANAEAKVKDGDYPGAIAALEEISGKADSTVTAKLAQYKQDFQEKSLKEAAALAEEGKYEEAVSTLNGAVSVLGSVEALTSKIEEYKEKYPVSLLDLSPSEGEDYSDTIDTGTVYDIYGNSINRYLEFYSGKGDFRRTEYVVDSKYKTFNGTFFVGKGSTDKASATFEIYVDDVLKHSATLTKKSRPTPFSVDITNATFVKITLKGAGGSGSYGYYFIGDPTFSN